MTEYWNNSYYMEGSISCFLSNTVVSENRLLISLGNGQYYTQIQLSQNPNLDQKGAIEFYAQQITFNGSVIHSSDKRLKTHIQYLNQDAYNFIHNLKPAYFIKDNEEHLGFYAQEVEEVNPWKANLTPSIGKYKGLNYTELIAPLVTYCQHLEKRITELETQLEGGIN